MLKLLKKEGFASMVEVIVSAIFFMVSAVAIFTSISMLRPQGDDSSERLEAVYVAKGFMEDLRQQVDASTWNSPGGPFDPSISHTQTINNYTIDYDIIDHPNLGVRELQLNITW